MILPHMRGICNFRSNLEVRVKTKHKNKLESIKSVMDRGWTF